MPARRQTARKMLLGGASALTMLGMLAGWAGPAEAVLLVADGKLDSPGYQLGYTVGFIDDKGNAIGDGQLWFGISDDSSQFLYFLMPEAYVDNRYGNYTENGFGWGKKGHSFNDLLGSDSLGTTKGLPFAFNGNQIAIDYIAAVEQCTAFDKKGKCTSSTTVDYRSGGVGTGADSGLNKNEGSVVSGSAASILEIATSLEYNLNQFPTFVGSVTDGAANSGWLLGVGYEIQFQAGTFNAGDWLDPAKAVTLVQLGTPHVSPSKTDFGDYGDPSCISGCTSTEVPEPGTLLILGGGFLALGWAVKRRRRSSEPDPYGRG